MLATLTIWTNARLPADAAAELAEGVRPHDLIVSAFPTGNLAAGKADPQLEQADIAFGQPDVRQVIELSRLKWIHLSSAGFSRYDLPEVRHALHKRGGILSNSSSVFAEPCAEHALAFMLSAARRLDDAVANKFAARAWPTAEIRHRSRLLAGETAIILGMGAIGSRLVELLMPLHMNLIGIRRRVRGDESIPTFAIEELDRLLPQADHVVNILPASLETDRLFNAHLFERMKKGAVFYNIGRGTTVNDADLVNALLSQKLRAAYLDVTDPEPLPPEHPLWLAPNCHITPHTAGGHEREFVDSVRHFLQNLKRFESGEALRDRVM
jgi:phosphoglycerate dehydrogenase-like enzyme